MTEMRPRITDNPKIHDSSVVDLECIGSTSAAFLPSNVLSAEFRQMLDSLEMYRMK